MVGQSPSIQSFFPLQSSPSKSLLPTSSPLTGDGFTFEELDATLHPLQQDSWTPSDDYDEYEIDSLMPGPKRIKIVGRIVNLLEGSPATKLSMNAKGSVHLVIKDDTGAVTVGFGLISLPACANSSKGQIVLFADTVPAAYWPTCYPLGHVRCERRQRHVSLRLCAVIHQSLS